MTTIDLEKRFNFPSRMLFINADSGEGNYGVEVFDDTGDSLLSVDLPTVEDRDSMFWFASAVLYQTLLSGEPDVPEEVLETLEKAFESGDLSEDPRDSEGRFELTPHPGLQAIQVEGYCVVKEEAMPEEWVADLKFIRLELASGRHYTLFPSTQHRLDPYGSTHRDFEDLKEDGRVPFRFQSLEVDRVADFACNIYHPAGWEELRGAKVLDVIPIVLDLKTRKVHGIEQKDILDKGVNVGMEEWSFADVERTYKELFDYHARGDDPTTEPFTLFELQATEHFYSFSKHVFQAEESRADGETYYAAEEFTTVGAYPKHRRRLYEPNDKHFLVSPNVRLGPELDSITVHFLVRGKYDGSDDAMESILTRFARAEVCNAIDECSMLILKDASLPVTSEDDSSTGKDRDRLYQVLFRLNKASNEKTGKRIK